MSESVEHVRHRTVADREDEERCVEDPCRPGRVRIGRERRDEPTPVRRRIGGVGVPHLVAAQSCGGVVDELAVDGDGRRPTEHDDVDLDRVRERRPDVGETPGRVAAVPVNAPEAPESRRWDQVELEQGEPGARA